MQIITRDDIDFPALLNALQSAERIGEYSDDGEKRIVLACPQFVLVSTAGSTEAISIQPSRSMSESRRLARAHLSVKENSGMRVSWIAENQ